MDTACHSDDGEILSNADVERRHDGGGDSTPSVNGPSLATTKTPGSYNFEGAKGVDYANKRGWSHGMITEAIDAGQSGVSTNAANGALCDVYGSPSQYVVIESVSRNLVQLSKVGDHGWIPDKHIAWFRGGSSNDIESIHK